MPYSHEQGICNNNQILCLPKDGHFAYEFAIPEAKLKHSA